MSYGLLCKRIHNIANCVVVFVVDVLDDYGACVVFCVVVLGFVCVFFLFERICWFL